MSLLGILGVAGAVGNLFKKFTGGNLGSAIIGDQLNKRSMNRQFNNQMALQDDAQAFNAEQAELNRNFNARQAELAREWQEQFYNKYQSPSAMMSQYRDAGINPMLVAGQGAGTPPSTSSASGSAASSGIGSAAAGNLVGDIIQLMMLKKQMAQMDAQTNLIKSQTDVANSQVQLNNSVKSLTDKQAGKVEHEVNLLIEQATTEQKKRELMTAQRALQLSQRENIEYSNALSKEFEKEFGYPIPVDTLNTLIATMGNLVGSTIESISSKLNPLNWLKSFKGKKADYIPFSEVTGNIN